MKHHTRYANKRFAGYLALPFGHDGVPSKRELGVMFRVQARERWRWVQFNIRWRQESQRGSRAPLTLEAKTWLTDNGLRGNLRLKAFIRLKMGTGGRIQTLHDRTCNKLSADGKRCTWERYHRPYVIERIDGVTPNKVVYKHSYEVPNLDPMVYVPIVHPRKGKTDAHTDSNSSCSSNRASSAGLHPDDATIPGRDHRGADRGSSTDLRRATAVDRATNLRKVRFDWCLDERPVLE